MVAPSMLPMTGLARGASRPLLLLELLTPVSAAVLLSSLPTPAPTPKAAQQQQAAEGRPLLLEAMRLLQEVQVGVPIITLLQM